VSIDDVNADFGDSLCLFGLYPSHRYAACAPQSLDPAAEAMPVRADGSRVVEFAAILYQGQTHAFPGEVEVIGAVPSSIDDGVPRLRSVLHSALA
jgi:hypothetical protein